MLFLVFDSNKFNLIKKNKCIIKSTFLLFDPVKIFFFATNLSYNC